MKDKLRQYLQTKIDPDFQKGAFHFFKEKVKIHGVRSPEVKRAAAKFWPEIKKRTKDQILDICEKLWQDQYLEECFIAVNWTDRIRKDLDQTDFQRFEKWIDRYVNNWASCDAFCTHPVGYLVAQHPVLFDRLKSWTNSRNCWLRRAAAVTLIHPLHLLKSSPPLSSPSSILNQVFAISTLLLKDPEDIVQKGYGWLLKEASNIYPKEVFHFVMNHKDQMPRTALRYAIEKLPKAKRARAMS